MLILFAVCMHLNCFAYENKMIEIENCSISEYKLFEFVYDYEKRHLKPKGLSLINFGGGVGGKDGKTFNFTIYVNPGFKIEKERIDKFRDSERMKEILIKSMEDLRHDLNNNQIFLEWKESAGFNHVAIDYNLWVSLTDARGHELGNFSASYCDFICLFRAWFEDEDLFMIKESWPESYEKVYGKKPDREFP